MNIKKTIEGNPILSLVGIVIAAVSLTSGVMTYFHNQNDKLQQAQHEQKLSDCESRLASINRGLAGGKYLDIRNLILEKDQPVNVPTASKFFSDDQFFASTDESQWTYLKTNEGELSQVLFGEELPAELQEVANRFPVHLWREKNTLTIQGNDYFNNLFAHVLLQRIPINEFRNLSEHGVSMVEGKDKSVDEKADAEGFLNKLDDIYRGDAVGTLLTQQLYMRLMGALLSQNTNFKLAQMQKVGNVVYAQSLITLKSATVGDKTYPSYYVTQELILISTSSDLYIIQTFIPSQDPSPRGALFASVTKWLDEFRVPIERL